MTTDVTDDLSEGIPAPVVHAAVLAEEWRRFLAEPPGWWTAAFASLAEACTQVIRAITPLLPLLEEAARARRAEASAMHSEYRRRQKARRRRH